MKNRVTLQMNARAFSRPFRAVGQWFAGHLVQNVPEELSVCEYDCDEPDCRDGKWSMCKKRPSQTYQIRFDPDR